MELDRKDIVLNVYRPLVHYKDPRGNLCRSGELTQPLDCIKPRLLVIPRKAMGERLGALSIGRAVKMANATETSPLHSGACVTIQEARSTPNGQVLVRPTTEECASITNTSALLRNKFCAAPVNKIPKEYEIYRFHNPDHAKQAAEIVNSDFIGYVLLFGALEFNMKPYTSLTDAQIIHTQK